MNISIESVATLFPKTKKTISELSKKINNSKLKFENIGIKSIHVNDKKISLTDIAAEVTNEAIIKAKISAKVQIREFL